MESRCIDSERIAEVVELSADHPTRRHVEECPRCRNLLRLYQEFVRAEPVAGIDADVARRKLDALIDSKVGENRSAASRRSSRGFRGMWSGLMRPAPLLAVAAVTALVAVVVWQQSRAPETPRLRSSTTSTTALPPADLRADGSIHLSWVAVPGADHYQVRIYGPGLTEIYRHPDVTETSVVIERSVLPASLPPTLDLMWRVYALKAGDVIETSEPGSIRTR